MANFNINFLASGSQNLLKTFATLNKLSTKQTVQTLSQLRSQQAAYQAVLKSVQSLAPVITKSISSSAKAFSSLAATGKSTIAVLSKGFSSFGVNLLSAFSPLVPAFNAIGNVARDALLLKVDSAIRNAAASVPLLIQGISQIPSSLAKVTRSGDAIKSSFSVIPLVINSIDKMSAAALNSAKAVGKIATGFLTQSSSGQKLIQTFTKLKPIAENGLKLWASWALATSAFQRQLKALNLLPKNADKIAKTLSLSRAGAAAATVAGVSPLVGAAAVPVTYFKTYDALEARTKKLGRSFEKLSTDQFKATLAILANWRLITGQIQASYAALQANLVGYEMIDINMARIKDKLKLSETSLNAMRDQLSQIGSKTGALRAELAATADLLVVEGGFDFQEAIDGVDSLAKVFERSGLRQQGETLDLFANQFITAADAVNTQNFAAFVDQIDALQKAVGSNFADITSALSLSGREITETTKTTAEEMLALIGVLQSQGLDPQQSGGELAAAIQRAQSIAAKGVDGSNEFSDINLGLQSGTINERYSKIQEAAIEVAQSFKDADGEFTGLIQALPALRAQLEALNTDEQGAVLRALFGQNTATIQTLLKVSQREIDDLFAKIQAQTGNVETPKAIADSYAQAVAEFNAALDDISIKISEVIEPIEKAFVRFATSALRATDSLPYPVEKLLLVLNGFLPVLTTIGTLLTPIFTQWVLWKVAIPLADKFIGKLNKGILVFKELGEQQKDFAEFSKKSQADLIRLKDDEIKARQELISINKQLKASQEDIDKGVPVDNDRIASLEQERDRLNAKVSESIELQNQVNASVDKQRAALKATADEVGSASGLQGQTQRIAKNIGTTIGKTKELGDAYVSVANKIGSLRGQAGAAGKEIDNLAPLGTSSDREIKKSTSTLKKFGGVVKEIGVGAFNVTRAVTNDIVQKVTPSVKAIGQDLSDMAKDVLPWLALATTAQLIYTTFSRLTETSGEVSKTIAQATREAKRLNIELNKGRNQSAPTDLETEIELRKDEIKSDLGFFEKLAEGVRKYLNDRQQARVNLLNRALPRKFEVAPFQLTSAVDAQVEREQAAISELTAFATKQLQEYRQLFNDGLDPDSTLGQKAKENMDALAEKLITLSDKAIGPTRDNAIAAAKALSLFSSETRTTADGVDSATGSVIRLSDALENSRIRTEIIDIKELEAQKAAYEKFGNDTVGLQNELSRISGQFDQARLDSLKQALNEAVKAEVELGQDKSSEIRKLQQEILQLEIEGYEKRLNAQSNFNGKSLESRLSAIDAREKESILSASQIYLRNAEARESAISKIQSDALTERIEEVRKSLEERKRLSGLTVEQESDNQQKILDLESQYADLRLQKIQQQADRRVEIERSTLERLEKESAQVSSDSESKLLEKQLQARQIYGDDQEALDNKLTALEAEELTARYRQNAEYLTKLRGLKFSDADQEEARLNKINELEKSLLNDRVTREEQVANALETIQESEDQAIEDKKQKQLGLLDSLEQELSLRSQILGAQKQILEQLVSSAAQSDESIANLKDVQKEALTFNQLLRVNGLTLADIASQYGNQYEFQQALNQLQIDGNSTTLASIQQKQLEIEEKQYQLKLDRINAEYDSQLALLELERQRDILQLERAKREAESIQNEQERAKAIEAVNGQIARTNELYGKATGAIGKARDAELGAVKAEKTSTDLQRTADEFANAVSDSIEQKNRNKPEPPPEPSPTETPPANDPERPLQQFLRRYGGARASGGPVQAGKSYIVGEKRPELFVPRVPGTIVPQIPQNPYPSMARVEGLLQQLVNRPVPTLSSNATFVNEPNPLQSQIAMLQSQMRMARGI